MITRPKRRLGWTRFARPFVRCYMRKEIITNIPIIQGELWLIYQAHNEIYRIAQLARQI